MCEAAVSDHYAILGAEQLRLSLCRHQMLRVPCASNGGRCQDRLTYVERGNIDIDVALG